MTPTTDKILSTVCAVAGTTREILMSQAKHLRVSKARHVAVHLLRQSGVGYGEIARLFEWSKPGKAMAAELRAMAGNGAWLVAECERRMT